MKGIKVGQLPYDLDAIVRLMPEMDGYEVGPIWLVGGLEKPRFHHGGARERCLQAGMDDHIDKPICPQHLDSGRVRRVRGGRRSVVCERARSL
jgi:hypothetical protein